MISWKLEITENETRLVVQDGAVMSSDILSLARHLVNKYHLSTLSIYDKNNERLFNYKLEEDLKCNNAQMKPFKKVTDLNFPYFLKKAEDLIYESGYVDQLYGVDFVFDVPKRQGNFADCLLCIDFLDIDEETERPSELYQFDLMELKWVKKKKKQRSWKDIMITNINWSTPDDVRVMAGLPDEIYASVLNINFSKYDPDDDLDYNEDFLDDVSDALTNKYGFCHDGFKIKIRRKENE